MRKFKRTIAMLAALALAGTLLAACGNDGGTSDPAGTNAPAVVTDADGGIAGEGGWTPVAMKPDGEIDRLADGGGTTLRIFAWNEEFMERFEDYFPVPEGIEVEWVITPTEGGAYQDRLDRELPDNASSDNPIDIFLIEADYALKYVNSPYTLDVRSLGIADSELADMYQYTLDVCIDSSGYLKGLSWQGCPGAFIYNRRIAEEVLGTDDKDAVQAMISDWDKFEAVAAQMKEANYFMVSGYDDAYRVFSNNVAMPWVDSNDNIQIDQNLWRWVDQTKMFTDNGFNNKTSLWGDAWFAGFAPDGNVFGYFGPGWFIDFVMADNDTESNFGAWTATEGPQGFNWGGTWVAAAAGTDNADLVGEVMRHMTINRDTLRQITLDKGDFVNNRAVMNDIANDPGYGNAFLGGQNHIAVLASSADSISMNTITGYDQSMNEAFQGAFVDYFNGTISREDALENFYTIILTRYNWLNR